MTEQEHIVERTARNFDLLNESDYSKEQCRMLLNEMKEQLFLYGVMWRLSGNDKFIVELRAITNLSMHDLVEEIKPLKASNNSIKNFYLATGKFPNKMEDKFLCEYGFDN